MRVGRRAGVALRAAHDDSVGPFLDDVHVEVGIGLRVRRQGTVALDVGLCHRHREVAVAAVLVERPGTPQLVALEHALRARTARQLPISFTSVTMVPPSR